MYMYSEAVCTTFTGFLLVPTVLVAYESRKSWEEDLKPFVDKYTTDLPDQSAIKQELEMWYHTFQNKKDSPKDLNSTLAYTMNSISYPNIFMLLKILLTIPVTSASTERANSTLKYVKTSLRSTMTQMSLNAFVLGYKHKALLCFIPLSRYVEKFIGLRKRRLYLNNPLAE